MLLLAGAMIATGAGRSATPAMYLEEAPAAASVLAVDHNDLWTAFGPTNVAIHQINVAAATNDWDTDLAWALRLGVNGMPTERQVRLHLDVARGHLTTGARDDALTTLLPTEATAPQQAHHHHLTCGIVVGLIDAGSRRSGIELARIARAVGVPA